MMMHILHIGIPIIYNLTWCTHITRHNTLVLLTVTSPPKIVKQPTQEEILFQVAQPGEVDKPFIIECEAEGEPAPKYVTLFYYYYHRWVGY